MRNYNTCFKMISSQCWYGNLEGPKALYFEIWGGRGPLGPPGSSAYVIVIVMSVYVLFSGPV